MQTLQRAWHSEGDCRAIHIQAERKFREKISKENKKMKQRCEQLIVKTKVVIVGNVQWKRNGCREEANITGIRRGRKIITETGKTIRRKIKALMW